MSPSLSPALLLPGVLETATLAVKKRKQAQREHGPDYHLSPEDRALKKACETDLRRFAEAFFPHLCRTPFSVMHNVFFAEDQARAGVRDLRIATAAPRGSAKTTIRGFIKIIHDCVYRVEQFITIFSHTASLAEDRVKQIRDELEMNERLVEVFGSQVGSKWNVGDFITRHGVRVLAASPQTQLRGVLERGQRVTKILLDDFENPEHVLSALQRQKTHNRFFSDIMKLGGPGTNVEVIGTILHTDSLLSGLLTNPVFTSTRYQAITRFPAPSALPLWQQWREMFLDLSNPTHIVDARAFYEQHTDAMLEGSAVLWPEREPYYDLMVMRLGEGESAFWLEKMNDPLGDAYRLFRLDAAAYCTITPQGIVRAGGSLVPWNDVTQLAMAYDPTPDKQDAVGDYAACVCVAQDRWGYVYVLGVYIAQEPSTQRQIASIVDMLWQFDCQVLGIESNNFASLLVPDIREAIAARAAAEKTPEFEVDLVPIQNVGNKMQRIKTLEPLWNNGWLQLAQGLPHVYLQQFQDFIPIDGAGHDDGLDATEMAVRVVKHLWQRRDAA